MSFTRFDDLEPPRPPPGYSLRAFQPGDEDAWIALLATGDFGRWDLRRLDWMLDGGRAPIPPGGILFATHADQLVGTVCTFLRPEKQGVTPEIGWVVVHPEHRGHGLATQLCRAALGLIRDLGHDYAYLVTEDFRLTAIAMYLRLGFEPEMVDASHPGRWEVLRRTLVDREGNADHTVDR
jgi:mycothiol synthase